MITPQDHCMQSLNGKDFAPKHQRLVTDLAQEILHNQTLSCTDLARDVKLEPHQALTALTKACTTRRQMDWLNEKRLAAVIYKWRWTSLRFCLDHHCLIWERQRGVLMIVSNDDGTLLHGRKRKND